MADPVSSSTDALRVVILAAGYGTRLEKDLALTDDPEFVSLRGTPKPLLPVGGEPLLTHWIRALGELSPPPLGVSVVVNNLHYQRYERWLGGLDPPSLLKVELINEGSSSNEARSGALACILLALVGDTGHPCLVLAGDTLLPKSFSITAFWHYQQQQQQQHDQQQQQQKEQEQQQQQSLQQHDLQQEQQQKQQQQQQQQSLQQNQQQQLQQQKQPQQKQHYQQQEQQQKQQQQQRQQHQASDSVSVIVSAPVAEENVSKHGILEVSGDGRVLRFLEKPDPRETESRIQSPCVYLLHPAALHLLQEFLSSLASAPVESKDAPGLFIRHLVARTKVMHYPVGERHDIGNLGSYVRCCQAWGAPSDT